MWGRGGLGVRETRVKTALQALVTRETCVKPWRYPLGQQPAKLQRNPTPQPRGISRKAYPGLVAGYEPD